MSQPQSVSCRKATMLIERRVLKPLGLSERLRLWLHLRICTACRSYQRQSAMIDRWMQQRRDIGQPPDAEALQRSVLKRING
ncbi:MAG: hypothetical protein IPK70_13535 [Flavobacteriales bacterium]|jgi:hypothetical protein|nr:hypothetical protein [Flavobacteriales bacterium]